MQSFYFLCRVQFLLIFCPILEEEPIEKNSQVMSAFFTSFSHLPIDWDLTPEHAITMYLEWGNNDWSNPYGPVTSKNDYSIYFVIDTWGEEPLIRLIKRNSEDAEDIASFPLPRELISGFVEEFGTLKGVFAPSEVILLWLRQKIEATE